MKVLCAFTRYNYGLKSRGTSIDYESFVPAVRDMGHEVIYFDTWDRASYPTCYAMNQALLGKVKEEQPDIVFTVQRDFEIWTETLDAIAALGTTALVTWTTDDSFKFFKYSRFIAPHYDAISTTYDYRLADYKAAGISGVCLTQWAANAHWLNPPRPANECKYKVAFIGTCYGARTEMMNQLKEAGIQVDCFGFGWPNGPIPSDQIPVIMRDSMISLNFSAGFTSVGGNDLQIKARTFEVPGAGGFLLTDPAPGLDKVYRIGEEIEVFDGLDELKSKIRYYLEHPEERDRIAVQGYVRTHDHHTYAKRLEPIFKVALEQKERRGSQKGNGVAALSPERGLTIVERACRVMLVAACRMIWGRERGLKAARRLTFEASVRLLGARTFTGKGLPGRLFPFV